MQFVRFTLVTSLGAIMALIAMTLSAPSAHADGPMGSTTASEKNSCQGDSYGSIPYGDTWDLKRGGERRPAIGHGVLRVGPSFDDSKVRVCGLTKHGSKTWGKPLPTRVIIGFEDQGGGNRIMRFWDKDVWSQFGDGRAGTPGKDRCAVIKYMIKFKGKWYKRVVTQSDVPDKYICN